MEDEGKAKSALLAAKRWLNSAQMNAEAGSFDAAIYSLQMASEISLKGLLFVLGTEAPRTHSIGDVVLRTVRENPKVSKRIGLQIEESVRAYRSLSSLRSVSGYLFETGYELKELKEKYGKYLEPAEKIIKLCEVVISEIP